MATITARHVEECWVLTGQRRGGVGMLRRRRHSIGEPTTVAFDAPWVLSREESHGDILGFLHTHPTGPAAPSRRDLRTMRAWTDAFGKPLLCLIAAPRCMAGFVFDGGDHHAVARIVQFDRGLTVAVE
ncbi:MAG TPA: Mov34/MPN/PAD-1 family protein [Tepidisphaeraceae bacterium]|jgi:proteasome lid subunit RPN8/RPN11|nr:Mov34/MPN/PAD-1 family protein [Tepidisphaeraceae bacterium]